MFDTFEFTAKPITSATIEQKYENKQIYKHTFDNFIILHFIERLLLYFISKFVEFYEELAAVITKLMYLDSFMHE